jgi:Tol biopolymer transport system component
VTEGKGESRRPSWLRAWLVVGLAAWAEIGIVLVDRAGRQGLVEDVSFSPYHLVGYAALLTLAVYVAWAVFRSLRHGGWRGAFPPLYGGLGAGLVLLVGWVVLDIAWRNTLGINAGIEGGIAPPRLLLPAALVLLAAGPLREAIADRLRPGISAGELRVRWAGVAAAGVIGAALTLTAFNPVREPLNDLSLNPGADATEIWTMAPDGSSQTRLLAAARDGVDYSLPAWSPDGKRIAYTQWSNLGGAAQNLRYRDQTTAIWTMAADGSDRRVVIDGAPDQAWIPAWSPDGAWIAYTLTPTAPTAGAAGPQANEAPGQIGPPATTAGASLWVVHPDGSGARRLTAEGVDAVGATWSPDGKRIAFTVGAAGGQSDIHVAAVTDTGLADETAVAPDPADDWGPAWSPDGSAILFNSRRSGNDDVWRAAIAGSGTPVQLTDDGAGDWVPVFSSDASRILFVSDRTGEPEIWSIAADGSDPRNLTNHPQHYDGQWSVAVAPDGGRIAYASGTYQDAAGSGWVREDFAAAETLLFALTLAIVAILLVALGAPLGSFTVALTIVVAVSALATDQWRFLPVAVLAGVIVDILVRSTRLRHRGRVAAAALPGLATLGIGLTIGAGGTLAWSITLLLGVSIAAALLGLGLAIVVERLVPSVQHEAHPTAA